MLWAWDATTSGLIWATSFGYRVRFGIDDVGVNRGK